MYLAGVSLKRVEDIMEVLWGSKVSPGTISNLKPKGLWTHWTMAYPSTGWRIPIHLRGWCLPEKELGRRSKERIHSHCHRSQQGWIPWNPGCRRKDERRQVKLEKLLHLSKEAGPVGSLSRHRWQVLRDAGIPRRGLSEREISALHSTLFPQCIFRHSTWKVPIVNRMLKAIHGQENKNTAHVKAQAVAQQLQEMKLTAATKKIETGINETLTYMDYPAQHWNKIRTNNLIERVNHELKRRTLSFERAPWCLSSPEFVMFSNQTGESNVTSTCSTCLNWRRRAFMNRKVLVDLIYYWWHF